MWMDTAGRAEFCCRVWGVACAFSALPPVRAKQRFCHSCGRLSGVRQSCEGMPRISCTYAFPIPLKCRGLERQVWRLGLVERSSLDTAGWGIPAVSWYKPCPNPKDPAAVAKQTHSSAAGIKLKPCCGLGSFLMEWVGDASAGF